MDCNVTCCNLFKEPYSSNFALLYSGDEAVGFLKLSALFFSPSHTPLGLFFLSFLFVLLILRNIGSDGFKSVKFIKDSPPFFSSSSTLSQYKWWRHCQIHQRVRVRVKMRERNIVTHVPRAVTHSKRVKFS